MEEPANEGIANTEEEVLEGEQLPITSQSLDDLLAEIAKREKETERKKKDTEDFLAWMAARNQKEEEARKEGETEVLSETRSNVSQRSSDDFQCSK